MSLSNITLTRGSYGLKRTATGLKKVNAITQRLEFFEKKIEQSIAEKENAENKILSNKRRKLNQEEALKLQVESLQQQLECVTQQCNTERELRLAAEHDRQAILQQLEVKQSQPSTSSSTLDKEALKELQRLQQQLELERQQSLEKIANLEKQLQKEIDEKTAQAEQSQKELMALREQVDNLQYGVRMNRALLKINSCLERVKEYELQAHKSTIQQLQKELSIAQSELRLSQNECEENKAELSVIRQAIDDKIAELCRLRSEIVNMQIKTQRQQELIEQLRKSLDLERSISQSLIACIRKTSSESKLHESLDQKTTEFIQSLNTQLQKRGAIIAAQEKEIKALKQMLAKAQAKAPVTATPQASFPFETSATSSPPPSLESRLGIFNVNSLEKSSSDEIDSSKSLVKRAHSLQAKLRQHRKAASPTLKKSHKSPKRDPISMKEK